MEEAALSVRDLAAELRRERPVVGRLGLHVGDLRVAVLSNDEGLLADLGRYFAAYRDDAAVDDAGAIEVVALEGPPPALPEHQAVDFVPRQPEPGKRGIKEESLEIAGGRLIRKVRTGMLFLTGSGVHLAVGRCRRFQNQIINFVNSRVIEAQMRAGWLLCHAAAVSLGERGLALAGFSGMGKSTLALHLMEAPGIAYVSNDRLLIKREGDAVRIAGVPKLPRINPGTAMSVPRLRGLLSPARQAELAALPTGELWALEDKLDVDVDAVYGAGRVALGAAARALMILNWTRGGGPLEVAEVDLSQRPDLLGVVMKSAGLFYDHDEAEGASAGEPTPGPYLEALAGLRVVECRGGVDFAGARAAGLELLRG
ncbi:MAG: HprK-related kinase B [Nannocystaceae bacterium]